MNAHTRFWTLAVVALLALTLLAVPAVAQIEELSVLAVEETADETTEADESESGRRALADTPRDRVGCCCWPPCSSAAVSRWPTVAGR
jgi:hypothetical protein